MSDTTIDETPPTEMIETLRRHTEALQQELETLRGAARQTTMLADLKVAAIKAGMVDLDGIKLLDLGALHTADDGTIPDAAGLMSDLKRTKPWLFTTWSTSSAKEAPPSHSPRQKQAMEMSDEEYHAARALILKRRP